MLRTAQGRYFGIRRQRNETQMKIFGYANQNLPPEEIVPAALAEITLCASLGGIGVLAPPRELPVQ